MPKSNPKDKEATKSGGFNPLKTIEVSIFAEHKGKRQKTKVRTCLNKMDKDTVYFDIRQFYLDEGTEDWLPTRKGISIHMDHLLDLQRAVKRAVKIAAKKGWLPDE